MSKEINTSSLFQTILEAQKDNKLPPVEKWDPPLCENVDMRIARDGKWFFKNSQISREKMIKLFSTVIRLDDDGCYYLPHHDNSVVSIISWLWKEPKCFEGGDFVFEDY